jgi:hypothetical protein
LHRNFDAVCRIGYNVGIMTLHPFIVFGAAVYALILLYRAVTDPLHKVPGPWLARITRRWELHNICTNHFKQSTSSFTTSTVSMHCLIGPIRHWMLNTGPIVRTAPNRYISFPEALQQIYGHGTKFIKDRW